MDRLVIGLIHRSVLIDVKILMSRRRIERLIICGIHQTVVIGVEIQFSGQAP